MKLIVSSDVHIEFDENRDHVIQAEEIAAENPISSSLPATWLIRSKGSSRR